MAVHREEIRKWLEGWRQIVLRRNFSLLLVSIDWQWCRDWHRRLPPWNDVSTLCYLISAGHAMSAGKKLGWNFPKKIFLSFLLRDRSPSILLTSPTDAFTAFYRVSSIYLRCLAEFYRVSPNVATQCYFGVVCQCLLRADAVGFVPLICLPPLFFPLNFFERTFNEMRQWR